VDAALPHDSVLIAQEQLLDDLARAFAKNRAILEAKAEPLDYLLMAVTFEAVLIAGAVISSLA
jgi:hypothetical protein